METTIHYFINELNFFYIFVVVFVFFVILYFFLAPIFNYVCLFLASKNKIQQITKAIPQAQQIKMEKKYSFISIIIFGFSGVFLVGFYRMAWVDFSANNLINVLAGLLLLSLFNELHFYIVHRIMHIKLLFNQFHYIHHQSKIPNVYSVYSFHPVEAFLLSTVPLCIAPFVNLASLSYVIFPLISILLNYAGHCNYRFGRGDTLHFLAFGTRHHHHHAKYSKRYGFALDFFDQLFSKNKLNK